MSVLKDLTVVIFLDIIDLWKLVGLGKMGFKTQTCWTDLLAFWGVWNRSRILNFGPDRLFFRFSRALLNKWCLCDVVIFFSCLYMSICCGYSLELHQQVDAIKMGSHNICLYKEVKKYTGCILKIMELLDCGLIGICAVYVEYSSLYSIWRQPH